METFLNQNNKQSWRILWALLLGLITGVGLNYFGANTPFVSLTTEHILDTLGKLFMLLLQMIVVPVVFVSLVNGTAQMQSYRRFGRIFSKTLLLYLCTTAIAVTLALLCASWLGIGKNNIIAPAANIALQATPSWKQNILNLIPSNPFQALGQGNLLQIILFSLLLGGAIAQVGDKAKPVRDIFASANVIVIRLVMMILWVAPVGIFALVANVFAQTGLELIQSLFGYFATVLLVLGLQLFVIYPSLLKLLAHLNPITFLRKMAPTMLFAFSTSSSNASIPVVLNSVEAKLGVNNRIAAFVIPLGATINMDGTAIMQGVATVFIANLYHITLGPSQFLMVILLATLASIGTAGIPSVGLITLAVVLKQLGLPTEGIAMILGIDRLLDMTRTAINITGDATIATIVAKSEQSLDYFRYCSS